MAGLVVGPALSVGGGVRRRHLHGATGQAVMARGVGRNVEPRRKATPKGCGDRPVPRHGGLSRAATVHPPTRRTLAWGRRILACGVLTDGTAKISGKAIRARAVAATPAGSSRRRARREVGRSQGTIRKVQAGGHVTEAHRFGFASAPEMSRSPASEGPVSCHHPATRYDLLCHPVELNSGDYNLGCKKK